MQIIKNDKSLMVADYMYFVFHWFSYQYLITYFNDYTKQTANATVDGGRTGLVVRASDSGSGDPGSILGRVGVLFS